MIKVITYGTYDLLHYGHIRLLERAKALGDYLIVGITSDSYDCSRGKINVQQPLMERIEAVRATGLADKILIEEYEGQKIDDIKKYGVDIFTVGADWRGHFDYLEEYCKVVYLDRTEGISSSELRSEKRGVKIGLVGEASFLNKMERESHYVNGISIHGICTLDISLLNETVRNLPIVTNRMESLLPYVDAFYIISNPLLHFEQIKLALEHGKHVLCESPIALVQKDWKELQSLAIQNGCVLMDAIRTAYSKAFHHLCLLVKTEIIGDVVSVDCTCTSLRNIELERNGKDAKTWNSICSWGPTCLLPIFKILGTEYVSKQIQTYWLNRQTRFDAFTKISFVYPHAVASMKVGLGAKSEGELVVSGTKGYVYVPAPWWKTDYFEVRFENPANNKRFFYALDGEGIRLELVSFLRSIETDKYPKYISDEISEQISCVMEDFYNGKDVVNL